MTTLCEAATQALEALEERYVGALRDKAMDALKAALEQPEQEPVAWMWDQQARRSSTGIGGWDKQLLFCRPAEDPFVPKRNITPLYTHPPRREWRGLTDVEWMNIVNKNHAYFGMRPDEVAHEVCKLTEAKLKELNHHE